MEGCLVNLIAVVDRNWAIGKDGDQLIYISADLKRFRALTRLAGLFFGGGHSDPIEERKMTAAANR